MKASGLLGTESGGGLDIGADFFSGSLQIPSGAGVDFLTIPGVSGKKAVLLNMYSTTPQSNITITIGGRVAVNNLTLAWNSSDVGQFFVGFERYSNSTTPMTGKDGESIIISKTSSVTSAVVYYSYAYMVV